MRTYNGIVQIGTTASGSSGTAQIWQYSAPDILIGSTYSADSVSPRSGYYTDLGTSTLRWKDLYLGGSTSSYGGINANGGLVITEALSNGILSSGWEVLDNAPIKIGVGTVSNVNNMDRMLYLNSKDVYVSGSGNQRVMIASNGVIMGTASDILVAGSNVTIDNGLTGHVHLGVGYNKTNYNSSEVVVGGRLAVRGVADDGSTQYDRSDWITAQSALRTTNANTTTITQIPWVATASAGNVVFVKCFITGFELTDASNVYSVEITGCYSIDASTNVYEIANPVRASEFSSWVGSQPDVEMLADANGVYIKVTGLGATTIQWLNSYSFHQIINIA